MVNETQNISELSDREREILHLVATGASNKEIASSLFISSNTVKVHLRNIFVKIGATSRTEAAMIAVSAGLVDVGASSKETNLVGEREAEGVRPGWISPRKRQLLLFSGVGVIVLLIVIGILAIRLSQTPSPAAASSSLPENQQRWREHEPLPLARQDLAVTAYAKKIYTFGGESAGGVVGSAERYDPETDSWESLPEKPTPVTEIGAAVLGGKIYIPGGRAGSGEVTNLLEVFDPIQNRWESRQSLPIGISAYALASFEGKLYLFGGWDGKQFINQVHKYDPAEDRWEEVSPMPTARGFAGAVVAGGNIYVLGGYDGKSALSVNEVYSPGQDGTSSEPWSAAKPLPDGRYAMGTCTVADIIHVLGGVSDRDQALQPSIYFPQEDEWMSSQDSLASSWSHLGVAALETRLFAIGGWWEDSFSARNYSFQAIYTISLPLLVR